MNGIAKMEEYLGHSILKLLKFPNVSREVEKFYIWLKEEKGYSQNSCRNLVNGAIQFLKYNGVEIKLRRSLGIYRTEISLSDHLLTSDQVQRMASVADLREQVILEVLLLGLRVSDAAKLKKEDFDCLEEEAPIPLRLRARKEGTIYRTFISQEFKELLKLYLPKIEGKWLLPGKRKGRPISNDALNWTLQELANRANIKIRGNLRWHCGRKLVMRSASELGINQWSIKALVGKTISADVATYLEGLSLKKDFIKLHSVLRLKRSETNNKISDVENIVKTTVEAIFELVEPIVIRKLKEKEIEKQLREGGGQAIMGLISTPSLEGKSPIEVIKLFLKLRREEKERE